MNRDYSKVGHAQWLANSPWGMGVLSLQNGQFISTTMGQSGTTLGAWRLDIANNQLGPCGNFDGDSECTIFVHSAWGIGALKAGTFGVFENIAMAGNGTALAVQAPIGKAATTWTVDTANTQYGPVGNFEGTGHDIIMVRGPDGIATLRQAGAGFNVGVAIWDDALVGGLSMFHTDRFGPVGDFDGDGADELVVVGTEGVWVLRPRADHFGWITFVGNGSTFGDWTLDTTQDQFGPAGDFDGDGKAELIVWRAGRFALLKVGAQGFTIMADHQPGDWIGGWRLGGSDRLGPAADFNGDRKPEILITSGWGLGVLAWSGNAFTASSVTANGTACGGWRLDTLRDRLTLAADFDGDGRAELFASSNWGIGLLDLSGSAPTSKLTAPNGSALGGWRLDTLHDDLTVGAFRSDALIAWNDNYADAAQSTLARLTQRGTFVNSTSDFRTFIGALQTYAATCAAGDRLFLYIALDGNGQARADGDTTQAPCGQHSWGFSDGDGMSLSQISPLFRAIAARGVDLVVFDGGCSGAETVYDAWGQSYVAISTTGMNEVGLTGVPDPGLQISEDVKPCVPGCWWSSPHPLASRMSGAILLASGPTHRVQQRLYRNDGTAMTKTSFFGRPTLSLLYGLTAWGLDVAGIYLYPIIFGGSADGHANPVQDLLTPIQQRVDNLTANYTAYENLIATARTQDCATLYANNSTIIWQCLANDLTWDVQGDPAKYSAQMSRVTPSGFPGQQGFLNLVDQARLCIVNLLAGYQTQAQLLQEIDAAVRASATLSHLAPPLSQAVPRELKLNPLDGQTSDFVAFQQKQAANLRAMAQRVGASPPSVPARVPTLRQAMTALASTLTQWAATALTSPTGDPTVDALIAKLLGSYQVQATAGNTACFVLSLVEDVLIAQQSANLVVPGDLAMI